MNILLGINTVLALFALFATAICILGWIFLKALKLLARLLYPLAEDEPGRKRKQQHPRRHPANSRNREKPRKSISLPVGAGAAWRGWPEGSAATCGAGNLIAGRRNLASGPFRPHQSNAKRPLAI